MTKTYDPYGNWPWAADHPTTDPSDDLAAEGLDQWHLDTPDEHPLMDWERAAGAAVSR